MLQHSWQKAVGSFGCYQQHANICACFAATGGGETESVFQGYVSRDRRKAHVVQIDQAAEQLLRRARAAGDACWLVSFDLLPFWCV